MTVATPHAPKRIGRPPGGRRPGEMVHQYPQLSLRVPPEVKATVAAIAGLRGLPQWRVVSDAIQAYAATLARSERQRVREVVRHVLPSPDE